MYYYLSGNFRSVRFHCPKDSVDCAECCKSRANCWHVLLYHKGNQSVIEIVFTLTKRAYKGAGFTALYRGNGYIAEWWGRCSEGTEPERRTEYGILRCIIEATRYMVEEEKPVQPDFRYMRQRVETWASEMNADGSWDVITTGEALQRLDILTGYANIYDDDRFNAAIERARSRCFEQVISHGTDPTARELFMLYRTLIRGIGQPDRTRAEAVAARAAERLNTCPAGSDEYLWSLALCMDCTCIKLNHDIKMQMLAQSA